jgi:sugar phosphate isomerase/epimerase
MHTSRRSFLSSLAGLYASSRLPHAIQAAEGTSAISAGKSGSLPARIPLGIDNFAVRGFGWKASELIRYGHELRLDTLFLSDLDCLPSLEEADLRKVKDEADAAGLSLFIGSWSICPTSKSFKNKWGTAEEHLRTGIRVARTLGSPVLRVILGNMEDRKTPGGIRARIEDTVKVLKAMRSEVRDAGVRIAVENHAGDMHSWELVRLVEEAGTDQVGVNLDTGNAAWTLEDPLDVVRNLARYVICSSLRDVMAWPTADGAAIQWTAVGDGLVDWPAVLQVWRELCPRVPFQIETISGFSRNFAYKTEAFWEHYEKRPEALARFEAMASRGRVMENFKAPEGVDKNQAMKEFQKGELERSVRFCREKLGLGLRSQ